MVEGIKRGKSTNGDSLKIAAFINKHAEWKAEIETLRGILNTCEVFETVKWGSPAYAVNGTTIISLVAFKNHYALWFHQGVFLTDEGRCLVNAQEGVTKGLRQWRFTSDDKIDAELVKQYVDESIANQLAGKAIKPTAKTSSKNLVLPAELEEALAMDTNLSKQFSALTPGRQKEYAVHIESAKQEKTRLSRVKKAIPLIQAGVGLNDKYKNC